jgi:lysophospholipase L1-like esterase
MINYFLSILFFIISFSEYIDSPENQNRIVNAESLQLFFEELAQIKSKENKVVSVVHIGDSHIQANYLTGKVRTLFQNNFGNAGRGVVFPYKIAGSYGPNDVQFSYDGDWEYCSIKKDFESNQIGLVGYSVSPLPNAELSIKVLEEGGATFKKITIFDDFGTLLPVIDSNSITWERNSNYTFIQSEKLLSQIKFRSTHSSNIHPDIHGIILKNDSSGILYHSTGVNGATASQYLRSSNFQTHITDLDATLTIISFGTNDSYTYPSRFCSSCVKEDFKQIIQRIKNQDSSMSILITTPSDHFFKRRYSNKNIEKLCKVLYEIADEEDVALWDLYKIMGGKNSILEWQKKSLARRDLIHFTKEGYEMQGKLLYEALMYHYESDFNL